MVTLVKLIVLFNNNVKGLWLILKKLITGRSLDYFVRACRQTYITEQNNRSDNV